MTYQNAYQNTYEILEEKVSNVEYLVNTLNRKANKLGLSSITLEIGERRIKEVILNGKKLYLAVKNVTITGEPPQFDGWQFVGILQHHEEGNIVRSFQEVPEVYRSKKQGCEHCGNKRARKDTYLIKNEDGEFMQVGSTCIKDFCGQVDPHSLASYLEVYLIDDLLEDARDLDNLGNGNGNLYFKISEVIAWSHFFSEKYGWVSKGNAREYGKTSTASLVLDKLWGKKGYEKFTLSEKNKEYASKVLSWTKELRSRQERLNDYLWNLAVACDEGCDEGYITSREVGIVASAIVAYKTEKEKKQKKEKETQSDFVGTVKKRQTFTNLTCTKIIYIDGIYGTTMLHHFKDVYGNILVWFSSSKELELNEVYSGKATVKVHNEYDGIKQTVLTRCSFK